jgi:hypothetical protein
MLKTIVAIVLLISATTAAGAQTVTTAPATQAKPLAPPTAQAAQGATAAPQQEVPPITETLRKLVGFLTVEYRDQAAYLVTNRHMAEAIVDHQKMPVVRTFLRLNLKKAAAGEQSVEGELPLGAGLRWYFPKDEAVDLAIMPLALPREQFDYEFFPVNLFATKDVIQKEKIAEGDPVLFTGFFYQYPGQKKIQPVVRQGVLAIMPDEPLLTTLDKPGMLYLADVHVFGGNSGSPIVRQHWRIPRWHNDCGWVPVPFARSGKRLHSRNC